MNALIIGLVAVMACLFIGLMITALNVLLDTNNKLSSIQSMVEDRLDLQTAELRGLRLDLNIQSRRMDEAMIEIRDLQRHEK